MDNEFMYNALNIKLTMALREFQFSWQLSVYLNFDTITFDGIMNKTLSSHLQ